MRVLIDGDAEKKICQKYKIRGYPTVIFTTWDGKPLSGFVGVVGPEKVIAEADKALKLLAKRSKKK